jgi:hypothetical protein
MMANILASLMGQTRIFYQMSKDVCKRNRRRKEKEKEKKRKKKKRAGVVIAMAIVLHDGKHFGKFDGANKNILSDVKRRM